MQIRVVDFYTGGHLNIACGELTLALQPQVGDHGLVVLRGNGEFLDVQDNLGHILGHTCNGAELVKHTVDTDAGHGSTGNGGQQGTTERVAHGVTEARLKGLNGEARTVRRYDLFSQSGALCNKHFVSFRWTPLYEPTGWGKQDSGSRR